MYNQFELLKYIIVPFGLFLISLLGIFAIKQNIIVILMCIELLLLSLNINFIIFSIYLDNIFGQIMALFILCIAGSESAIGLAILIVYYRIKGVIAINYINSLKS